MEKLNDWLREHRDEIIKESMRLKMTPAQFVTHMLDDALEAYKNVRTEEFNVNR